MQQLKYLLVPLFFLLLSFPIAAQSIGGVNFENLKADDLSDQQIIQLHERMQDEGLTIAEVEAMAIARGTSPAEVAKLRSRLNAITSSDFQDDIARPTDDRAREFNANRQIERSGGDTLPNTRIFGASIFSNQNISFEPSLNIATPSNYTLGPGDELIVDIWGASENTYELSISPEGAVQISNIGPVFLSGLTIEEATQRLTDKLAGIYSGIRGSNPNTFLQVTLGDIRSINVSIIGEASNPGTYTLSSLSTVFNALYAAGGPNRTGTYRAIEIIREDEVREVDLYEFLVSGDLSGNFTLKDQDIIKIDPYINRIELEGEVKRPGIFETKEGETLEELLQYAGGFTQNAFRKRIKIQRTTETEKSIVDVRFPEEANTVLESGDIVTVGKVLDRFANKITIEGAVFRPGDYQLENNSTLYTLIENAEGLMGDAYLERAIIYRTRPDYTIETIRVNLTNLLEDPETYDIPLVKEDLVRITSIFDLQDYRTVRISGFVNSPDTFPYVDNFTLRDLILEADGFSDEATPYRIEVARRISDDYSGQIKNEIAEVYTIDLPDGLSYHPELEDLILQPYDQVFVRKSPGYETQQTVRVTGEVLYPGTYVLSTRDYRLSDLIRESGGITPYSFIEGASLEREFNQINTEIETTLSDSIIGEHVGSLDKVGINLDRAIQNPASDFNLRLQPGDVVHIPRRLETVQIRGEVLHPVNARFREGRSFRSYISAAGGFTENANTNSAYIVYANGEVDRTKRFLFFKSYPEVRPGAVLIIPPEEERERLSTAERITVMSTIVSLAAIVTNTFFQIRNSNN